MAKYNLKLFFKHLRILFIIIRFQIMQHFFFLKNLAVKIIKLAGLSYREEEKFLDVICTASRLKHPNIVAFRGYCLERGEHLLVYDYIGNLTLNDALHSGACKPLLWLQRLRIAIGVAEALE